MDTDNVVVQLCIQGMRAEGDGAAERADRVGDARVTSFYPSLHANIGRACLELDRADEAGEQFRLAAERIVDLPAGPYTEWLRDAIAEGPRVTAADT
ncbi:hypothetical protein SAMN05216266_108104 [Amycolatopsis marina]|uniref:Transcriptional activator domain-containing protein n=1 Tax=Amycolatopsis marina TaxID=490629 RepID=A0A1I1A3I6_9PSEU|nr:hypothetical protein [Amycolatopsis marina]SFB31906.1 hypothetical protein SAMN05216266_108104 [Amycolatopsis marina]